MSNAGDRVEGRIKESKKCLYCGDLMQEAQMPGCPPYTKGFVCPKCGFVAFFVGTHMGDYYGVQMAKEREASSFSIP